MIKVIGVDPAPSKNSVLFDGKDFKSFKFEELKEYIQNISKIYSDLLVCWDAPLAGSKDSLTIRKIERFFYQNSKNAKELSIPKGISTLGYASLPHWSISQYIFGLPIINKELQKEGKFKLLTSNIPIKGLYIAETHPALSMWIILKNRIDIKDWIYKGRKGDKKLIKKFHEALMEIEEIRDIAPSNLKIENDDQLDAFVTYIVGKLYLKDSATIYGDNDFGAFLLPKDNDLLKRIDEVKA